MRPARLAADLVAAALGLNLWISLVLVPSFVAGSFTRYPAAAILAPLPLGVLFIGVVRRSPLWLLLAYPAALLLPVAVDEKIATASAASPWALALTALSLAGYLMGAAYLSSYAAGGEPRAGRTRRLAGSLGAKSPPRWQRRRRIYAALTALSVIMPVVLLYKVAFDPSVRGLLLDSYPTERLEGDRAQGMLALMLTGLLALWLVVFATAFVGPLRRHRTGDKELVAELDRLRLDAQRASPRLRFYIAVVIALGLMAALVVKTRIGH
jgi:hypothetical protein